MRHRLALAALTLAGCGSAATTVTHQAATPRYSAHDAAIKQKVQGAIENQISQDRADQGSSSGTGVDLSPVDVNCIASSDTQLDCQVSTASGDEHWTATVDRDTGRLHAQRDS